MRLIVCALPDVVETCASWRPSRIVSLLSPGTAATQSPVPEVPRLNLFFHDISEPRAGLIAPDTATVSRLLEFGAESEGPVLVHCWAGISRSTAAAYALACLRDPHVPEDAIAATLRRLAPWATPNPLIVDLADRLLGRNGRMTAAIAAIGRGCDAGMGAPFTL